jgi:hypothetical protein
VRHLKVVDAENESSDRLWEMGGLPPWASRS